MPKKKLDYLLFEAVIDCLFYHGPQAAHRVAKAVSRPPEVVKHLLRIAERDGFIRRSGTERRPKGRPVTVYEVA